MFIINISYKVPLTTIDQYLQEHISYLNKQYNEGIFQASGKKVPRTGGIILAHIESKQALLEIVKQDPFYKHQLAEYELIEFVPSTTSKAFQFW